MKYFGLVDCNSFYCSCERVFRPEIRGRPVIVLSNNDGCAIAFTKEAKALGFGEMCEPFYKLKDRIKKHNVAVFSSNYTLYDNLSRRVMSILNGFTPCLEIYSVDEAFLELDGFDKYDLLEYGKKIRSDVLQFTGIPVGVGIAKTKVLSKIANKLSKKQHGVMVFKDDEEIDQILKSFPVKDIWGIGHASSTKLNMLGIKTAYDFKIYKDEQLIQKLLTKVGRQVQDELRGISCLPIEEAEDKKNTGNSRSFGSSVYTKSELREALADFCTNSAAKLRAQESVCFSLTVFIQTNYFNENAPQYYGTGSQSFISGTSDTLRLIKGSHQVLDNIFKSGYEYKKGGVLLNHIVPRTENQMDLFDEHSDDNEKLGQVVDLINKRYGAKTIQSAACGSNQAWRTVANFSSPKYTNAWKDILRIKLG
jgi:DNA polymerase V